MKLTPLAFILGSCLVFNCAARIGETRAECDARYGKPAFEDGRSCTYEKSGLSIEVGFMDGKCAFIRYTKPMNQNPPAVPKMYAPLSKEEITALLQKESSKWDDVAVETQKDSQEWKSPEAHLLARYDAPTKSLTIKTEAFVEYTAKKRQAEAEERLKDL